VKLQINKISK